MSDRVSFCGTIIWQKADENGLTLQALQEDFVRLVEIQKELEEKKLPLLLIYDATNVRSAGAGIRKQAIKNMSALNYQKAAVFGIASNYLKYMANFVILGMGKADKIRIFNTKEEAENWVRS